MSQKIQPKNKEQEEAIRAGQEFIKKSEPDEFLLIAGKAGTGKTTIAMGIVEPYINKKVILVMALAHQAKLVIQEKFIEVFGKNCVTAASLAKGVGMNMDLETGKFSVEYQERFVKPPIATANIIIVDEASMINEKGLELIMTMKKKKAKVIFLGDIRQLPPIREKTDPLADAYSPVFLTKKYVVLKERIRQGEGSPILPFSDYFGDNSIKKFPDLSPAKKEVRKSIVLNDGALVFYNDIEEVIDEALPLFQKAVETKDGKIIKVVSYRRDARIKTNDYIRKKLFGIQQAANQFVVGDILAFSDNYTINELKESLSNGTQIQVTKVERLSQTYELWKLHFLHESRPASVLALDNSEIERHAQDIDNLFLYAQTLHGEKRASALSDAWGLKRRFAPVEYAYAVTSHKSQGSTFNTVIVDETDIMTVGPISNRTKSQSLYVAITRAAVTSIIIDGTEGQEEFLHQALELSKSKIIEKPIPIIRNA